MLLIQSFWIGLDSTYKTSLKLKQIISMSFEYRHPKQCEWDKKSKVAAQQKE